MSQGLCWRTTQGMPFGVLLRRVTKNNWWPVFGSRLFSFQKSEPQRDFSAYGLDYMRRCLISYAGLAGADAGKFTLHSCKVTTLSGAAQLNISLEYRALQGHRRLPNACVKNYSRDD